MRNCSKNTHKKGFTLIEIIIAIAVLGMLSVVLLSMFGMGFNIISRAGKSTSSGYSAQALMENSISNSTLTSSELNRDTTASITLYKSNVPYTTINGIKLDVTYDFGGTNRKMTTFISN